MTHRVQQGQRFEEFTSYRELLKEYPEAYNYLDKSEVWLCTGAPNKTRRLVTMSGVRLPARAPYGLLTVVDVLPAMASFLVIPRRSANVAAPRRKTPWYRRFLTSSNKLPTRRRMM